VIVLDASAAVDWLLQTPAGQQIEKRIYARSESLHAPHLLDVEVAQVLRRLVREAVLSAQRAEEAIQDLADMRVARYPHFVFLSRIWRVRHNLSAYDAAYRGARREIRRNSTNARRPPGLSASGRGVAVEVF
jgi:predicted nucleic acid-binding protein